MMLAYRICTWAAIALLAFGSVAVFIIFLVTTLRQLHRGRKPSAEPPMHQKTPPS